MENEEKIVTFSVTQKELFEVVEKGIKNTLASGYGNPVQEAINKVIKSQEGILVKLVEDIIKEKIINNDFKSALGDAILTKLVESALRK